MTTPVSGGQGAAATLGNPIWQRLWLRCHQSDWQSLALVGSSARDPEAMLEIAQGLARIGKELGQELAVFDARKIGLVDMDGTLQQVKALTQKGKRCLVVLNLVSENATTVPMVQSLDAALIGVFIGETTVVAASRTVDEAGRSKFLGSIVLQQR
ncbi:MAG: hypothetical protein IPF92_27270 [Myxococcales bacterium]|jgi:hypothetical protein|nr:hypothetical protein [Myxococcales bacterium]MBL0194049.1 hypothetical protein [Myxococcales bacterium]HQY62718.1 hypothetical protein [Polyangiaceae bacterium]